MRNSAVFLAAVLLTSTASYAAEEHDHHAAHGAKAVNESSTAQKKAMDKMHHEMAIEYSGNADVDFARGMIPHHQGAVEMAKIQLKYGKDPELRKLAQEIIDSQEKEIKMMQKWLSSHDKAPKQAKD